MPPAPSQADPSPLLSSAAQHLVILAEAAAQSLMEISEPALDATPGAPNREKIQEPAGGASPLLEPWLLLETGELSIKCLQPPLQAVTGPALLPRPTLEATVWMSLLPASACLSPVPSLGQRSEFPECSRGWHLQPSLATFPHPESSPPLFPPGYPTGLAFQGGSLPPFA